MQPTIDNSLRCRLRAVEVPLDYRRALHQQLAGLSDRQYFARLIDDFALKRGHKRATALGPCEKQIPRGVGADSAYLSHTVTLSGLGALRALDHFSRQIGMHRRTTPTQ